MYPADFDYARAASLDEALGLLHEAIAAGQEAKVIAGGQSLLPMMKLRLAAPQVLIDLADIRQLRNSGGYGSASGSHINIAIGALTTYRELQRYARLIAAAPAIGDALAVVADPQVRARGTIGGAVAHGDPAADLPAVLLALDADVTIASPPGTRMRQPRTTPPPRTLGPVHQPRTRTPEGAPLAQTQTIPLDSFLQGIFIHHRPGRGRDPHPRQGRGARRPRQRLREVPASGEPSPARRSCRHRETQRRPRR
jgi:hypothetical protein